MADVYAIFGTLLAVGIAFPGMLTAFWLLFPGMTNKAEGHVATNLVKSGLVGLLTMVVLSIPIAILLALPFGPAKFMGGALLLLSLSFAGLGAAGVAGAMAAALQDRTDDSLSAAGAFIRGAISLELAAAFPVVGWFVVLPVTLIISLGASTLAALGPTRDGVADSGGVAAAELAHEPQSA